MMTRETKAGLVVSCSFLCLVGVVLVSKLREASHTDAAAETALAEVPAEPQPVPEGQTESSAPAKVVQNNAASPKSDKYQSEGKIRPAAFKGEDGASALPGAKTSPSPLAAKTDAPLPPKNTVPSAEQKQDIGTAIEDTVPTADGDKDKANAVHPTPAAISTIMIAEPSAKSDKATILNWVPDREKKKATSLQGMGLRPAASADAATLAGQTQPARPADAAPNTIAAGDKPSIELPPLPAIKAKPETSPEAVKNSRLQIKSIAAVAPVPVPTAAVGAAEAGALALPGIGSDTTVPGSSTEPKSKEATAGSVAQQGIGGDGKSGKDTIAVAPSPGQGNGIRGGLVGIQPLPSGSAQEQTGTQSGPVPGRPALATQPDNSGQDKAAGQPVRLDQPVMGPANQSIKETSSPVSPQTVNEDSSRGTRAPLGAPLPAVSPIVAPALTPSAASSGSPQVESYDEDTYTCKANETFRSISQAVYRTDAYDQALLLFNRNHPLANEAIKQNPPLLQAGQPIYIPPLQILRKYYAASIPDSNNPAPLRNPASIETPGASQPVTLAPPANGAATATSAPAVSAIAAPTATATGALTATASTRTYRVGAAGEMIRDIARRTLGNGDRWTEIYQLNRSYDPMYAVPAGTELRLPADAHVDTQ